MGGRVTFYFVEGRCEEVIEMLRIPLGLPMG